MGPGKISHEQAKLHAETEFEKYRIIQDRLFESDFDRFITADVGLIQGKIENGGMKMYTNQMVPYHYGRRATTNTTTNNALNATDYAISVAGAFGARTTEASLALSLGQLGRLAVAPQTVNKPINAEIKAVASVALVRLPCSNLKGSKSMPFYMKHLQLLKVD